MLMTKLTAIFVLIISIQTFAQDKGCLGRMEPYPELKNLAEISKHLDWHAASDAEIKGAHCLRKNPITEAEMNDWLSANQSSQNISKKINGIQFENESIENLKSFEYLTTALDFFGKVDPALQKQFTSSCKKVDCAVKEIFGKAEGLQLLYMQRKFGMNGSHLAKKSTSSWKKEELDVVLLSLTDFPEGVLPFEANRPLVHFERGYMLRGGDGVIADATIELFDLWNEQTPEKKRYTVTHEMGHALAGVTNLDDNKKWMDLSGWSQSTKIVDGKPQKESHAKDMHSIISKYGETNQAEDFAESVAAYRYHPKRLLEANPKKYNLIKEAIFDNVEYTSEEACNNPKRLSSTYQETIQKVINEWTPTPDQLNLASKKCNESIIVKLSADGAVNLKDREIQNCYEKAINQQAKELGMKLIDNLPNKEFLAPMFRNIKLAPIQSDKLNKMVKMTQDIHRKNLKTEFNNALKKDYNFPKNEPNEKFQYVYQSFDKSIGFEPFSRKEDFSKIADKLAKKINETNSLRRKLHLDFSESEISEQVDLMIR